MTKKEHLFIELLRYGRGNPENGVSFKEVSEFLNKKGHSLTDELLVRHYQDTFDITDDEGSAYSGHKFILENDHLKGRLRLEAYFRLIEYEEFKSANKSSLRATVFAIIAISISIFATHKSITYSEKQMNSAVSINASQLEELKALRYDDREIKAKLDKIIISIEASSKDNKAL